MAHFSRQAPTKGLLIESTRCRTKSEGGRKEREGGREEQRKGKLGVHASTRY